MNKKTAGAASLLTAKALWPVPVLLGASFIISWAAEAAQFFISQGLSLAILAWIQALPEFAVEATIAWRAGQNPLHDTTLVIANLTGSLRILVGLAWPMIYTVAEIFHYRRHGKFLVAIRLKDEHAVEVVCLVPCLGYFFYVWAKDSLTLADTAALLAIYVIYLAILHRMPPEKLEETEDMPVPVRKVLALPGSRRVLAIVALFVIGGGLLFFAAGPFLHTMEAAALSLGISQFFLVQWISPLLSEFPEKLAAFNWARRIHTAPMALMNMASSNINQWTLLPAMLPPILCYASGDFMAFHFNPIQEREILLTLAQSVLGLLMIWKLSFYWGEALLLFALWLAQFCMPSWREEMLWVYLAAIALEIAWLSLRPGRRAHRAFIRQWRQTRAGTAQPAAAG